MDILSSFGEALADLIFDKKVTPEQFANAVEIDVSVIYRYLRKENIPSLQNSIKIADYLNCSLDFLFGLSTEEISVKYKTAPAFSIRFQELLKENDITRYRLCKEAHISDQRVDDWYHGKRVPTVESLINLSKFFDCSLDYLVGRN